MNDQENLEKAWYILHTKVFDVRLAECFSVFREAGIEPVLIKGWAIARFYNEERKRVYTDIDLCVEPSLYETALRITQSEEYGHLNIDLHKGFKTLATCSWNDLFDRSQLIDKDGSSIRVLCPEDHLRILAVHWLTDGGEFKDKLWDIYYLVKNRPEDFDWNLCLSSTTPTRRKWIISAIGLAGKYLGLDLRGLPFEAEAKDLPNWLTKTVEAEWKSSIRLIPLRNCPRDFRSLWQQFRKRFPPNAIQATVNLEGEFDNGTRIFYQIRDVFKRL